MGLLRPRKNKESAAHMFAQPNPIQHHSVIHSFIQLQTPVFQNDISILRFLLYLELEEENKF